MSKKIPIIGITALWDKPTNSTVMRPSYINALEYAGAMPVIIPLTESTSVLDHYLDICDGILLSGGQDVQPELYGETPQPHCGEVAPCRDKLDRYAFESALDQDKPILGICRGCQAMNVFAGGSLYQDLTIDFGTEENHRMVEPFNRTVHQMIPQSGTVLAELLGEEIFEVNSIHHQGIKRLAEPFDIMAVSPDGIIEAIYMPKRRFVWGVQWHPELLYQNHAKHAAIFSGFVKACS